MRYFMLCLLLVTGVAQAQGVKSCEELKREIAEQLDTKGVRNYQLDIVENDQVGDRQVVGSCDGGTKKITYEKR